MYVQKKKLALAVPQGPRVGYAETLLRIFNALLFRITTTYINIFAVKGDSKLIFKIDRIIQKLTFVGDTTHLSGTKNS